MNQLKQAYKLLVESQQNKQDTPTIDDTMAQKIKKLTEKKSLMETNIKELEEEIKYLSELGQKKSELESAKQNMSKIKEEINTLKNKKIIDETPEEKDVLEEQTPRTTNGKVPGQAKNFDMSEAKSQKKKICESAWEQYKKTSKKSTVTKDDCEKFSIIMG